MNQIYRWLGTTKQNVHQRLNREIEREEEERATESYTAAGKRGSPEHGM